MNDQDYIRKAVELADGWSISQKDILTTAHHGYFGNIEDIEILDALAAQLVRQVDALDDPWVTEYPRKSIIYSDSLCQHIAEVKGPDRTMNTIKAIVDSGVLS